MKHLNQIINNYRHYLNRSLLRLYVFALLPAIVFSGCKKDNDIHNNPVDESTIKFVLKDNFNFGGFSAMLDVVGLTDSLGQKGPFTVFAPVDAAYASVNILPPYPLLTYYFTRQQLLDRARYYIINDAVALNKLPLVQNKAYLTRTGGYIYISKYIDGGDTVITVNGIRLVSTDNAASNGIVQVMPQLINPETYHTISEYIHTDTSLTLFAAAMYHSGLETSLLQGKDQYTVLGLSNAAMLASTRLGKNLGLSTMDSVLSADPAKLAVILKDHIIGGMNFEGDLYRLGAANPAGVAALSGNKIVIGGNPAGFHAITFQGAGNSIPAKIALSADRNTGTVVNNANIPCGNGVVHIINQVLIP
jgi:uncharacterized surface protein with fasciclin (FAS1) repeats